MVTLGVLLAGGRGARLAQGVPKALARAGGRTLLEHALEVLRAASDEVVVVAPSGLDLPPVPGASRVSDPPGDQGPLAALVAGLEARPFERAIVLGVDFPLVRRCALLALADRLGDHAAVVPAPGGVPQPLAAAYAPRSVAFLAAQLAAGERALVPAVARLDPLMVGTEDLARLEGGAEAFLNVNTAADLARAEGALRAREAPGPGRPHPPAGNRD